MTFLYIAVAAIALLLLFVVFQLKVISELVAKIGRPPLVKSFYTFEGLLEFCRQHYPNCYQKLLMMRDSPHWQARLGYSRTGRFDSDKEGIPLYRYFDGLELLAKGTYDKNRFRLDDLELYYYEQAFIGEVRDDDKIYDAINQHLPLPPDFEDPDED